METTVPTQAEEAMSTQIAEESCKYARFFSKKLNEAQKGALGHTAALVDSEVQKGINNSLIFAAEMQKAGVVSEDLSLKTVGRTIRSAGIDVEHLRQHKNGAWSPKAMTIGHVLLDDMFVLATLPKIPRLLPQEAAAAK